MVSVCLFIYFVESIKLQEKTIVVQGDIGDENSTVPVGGDTPSPTKPSGASEQEEAVYDEEIQDPVERERRRSGLGLCVSLRVLCVTVIFSLRFNKTCYYFMLFKIIFEWD